LAYGVIVQLNKVCRRGSEKKCDAFKFYIVKKHWPARLDSRYIEIIAMEQRMFACQH
jgi:hypothetical protein